MTTSESTVEGHTILLYLKRSDDNKPWWERTLENDLEIRRYSEQLGQSLSKQAFTRLDCNDEDEAEALATIIQEIPGTGRKVPELSTKPSDYGFSRLLHLSASLVKYKCSIPPSFHQHAKKVYDKILRSQTIPQVSPLHWMFIALVFGWERLFEVLSVAVLIKYDASRTNEELTFLPEDFQDLVIKKRTELIFETWEYIRNSCLFLAMTGSIKKIADDFEEAGLILRDHNPTAIYNMNADQLLNILETSIKSEDEMLETTTQNSKKTERPSAIDARGTGFGAMFRCTVHEWLEKSMRHETNSLKGSTSSSEQSEWKQIENETSIWRRDNLETKVAFNVEFDQLRNKYIQRDYPEHQKKVPADTRSGQARKPVPHHGLPIANGHPPTKPFGRKAHLGETSGATMSSSDSEYGVGGSNSSVPPTVYDDRSTYDNPMIRNWQRSTRNQREGLGPRPSFRSEGEQSYQSR